MCCKDSERPNGLAIDVQVSALNLISVAIIIIYLSIHVNCHEVLNNILGYYTRI